MPMDLSDRAVAALQALGVAPNPRASTQLSRALERRGIGGCEALIALEGVLGGAVLDLAGVEGAELAVGARARLGPPLDDHGVHFADDDSVAYRCAADGRVSARDESEDNHVLARSPAVWLERALLLHTAAATHPFVVELGGPDASILAERRGDQRVEEASDVCGAVWRGPRGLLLTPRPPASGASAVALFSDAEAAASGLMELADLPGLEAIALGGGPAVVKALRRAQAPDVLEPPGRRIELGSWTLGSTGGVWVTDRGIEQVWHGPGGIHRHERFRMCGTTARSWLLG